MCSILFLFGVICVKMAVTQLSACPESCFCMDSFVTCSDFNFLDLTLLPPSTDTLVLTKGDVEEIPPGFLATATNLKILELMAVNVRIVRGSAFRGLRHMDLLSITSCSFDIVEPDGFSGLTEVGKIHISDSTFGRLGKHAFAYINNVPDFKIWASNFETIADEAFYKLSEVASFQFYHNNVTTLGKNVFLGSARLDDVGISMNRIHTAFKGSFDSIAEAADRMMLNANTFVCSCDVAWLLEIPNLEEYLGYNFCSFPGKPKAAASTFILSEVSKDSLCFPSTPALESTTDSSQDVAHSEHSDDFSLMEEMMDYDIHEAEEVRTALELSKLSSDSASTFSTNTKIYTQPMSSLSSSSISSSLPPSSAPSSASSLLLSSSSSSFLALLISTSPPPPPPQPSSVFSFSESPSSSSTFSRSTLLSSLLMSTSTQTESPSAPATNGSVDPLLPASTNSDTSPPVSSNSELPSSPLSNLDISSFASPKGEISSFASTNGEISSSTLSSGEISSSSSSDGEILSSASSDGEISSSASSNSVMSSSTSSKDEISSSTSTNKEISSSDSFNDDISPSVKPTNQSSHSVSSNGTESSSASLSSETSTLWNNEISTSVLSDSETASSATKDVTLVLSNQSSPASPFAKVSETDSLLQSHSEQAAKESTILTSLAPSSVASKFQNTEWPRDEEADNTEHINTYDSTLTDNGDKLVHKQDAKKATHNEADKPDTVALGTEAHSTAPTNTDHLVTNKHEHAIAYTEAAFAMADPSSHNDAQTFQCPVFFMLLSVACAVFKNNYYSVINSDV